MFTGIVEEVGKITNITRSVKSSKVTITGSKIFEDLHLGDSIATNGLCLTVSSFSKQSFTADIMQESLKQSNLGNLKVGSRVNLERAMLVTDRFGGHIVSGHIDGVGKIVNIKNEGNATWFIIEAQPKVMRYIIEKGSITIDGISLTVAVVSDVSFSVSIIPHTIENTILNEKQVGDFVNLENDLFGKYVEKLLFHHNEETSGKRTEITKTKLAQFGF